MSRVYDKPIAIEKLSDSGEWEEWKRCRASVNKTSGGERSDSGARRAGSSLIFEIRYTSALFDIFLNTQDFRIIYRDAVFYIDDYDDYMEKHINVRLTGVCNGERQDHN